jgi:hypothetical protein
MSERVVLTGMLLLAIATLLMAIVFQQRHARLDQLIEYNTEEVQRMQI